MEALFRPSSHLPVNEAFGEMVGLTEVELKPEYTFEDVKTACTTFEDFCSLFSRKIIYMNDSTYIAVSFIMHLLATCSNVQCISSVNCDGSDILSCGVCTVRGVDDADTAAAYDLLLHLAAITVSKSIVIEGGLGEDVPFRLPGPVLVRFLAVETLEKVYLHLMLLDEEHVRALATCTREGCEVILSYVKWTPRSLPALVECMHADAGPTKIVDVAIAALPALASGLSGNSRINFLSTRWDLAYGSEPLRALFRGIGENLGLLKLNLSHEHIDDDAWMILFESMKFHPAIKTLQLYRTLAVGDNKLGRTRALADMLRDNKVLETVELLANERDEDIYQNEILPCLERNVFIPRVACIKRTQPESLRLKVLGRSFTRIQGNTNLIWMFLSGNVDVAIPTAEEVAARMRA